MQSERAVGVVIVGPQGRQRHNGEKARGRLRVLVEEVRLPALGRQVQVAPVQLRAPNLAGQSPAGADRRHVVEPLVGDVGHHPHERHHQAQRRRLPQDSPEAPGHHPQEPVRFAVEDDVERVVAGVLRHVGRQAGVEEFAHPAPGPLARQPLGTGPRPGRRPGPLGAPQDFRHARLELGPPSALPLRHRPRQHAPAGILGRLVEKHIARRQGARHVLPLPEGPLPQGVAGEPLERRRGLELEAAHVRSLPRLEHRQGLVGPGLEPVGQGLQHLHHVRRPPRHGESGVHPHLGEVADSINQVREGAAEGVGIPHGHGEVRHVHSLLIGDVVEEVDGSLVPLESLGNPPERIGPGRYVPCHGIRIGGQPQVLGDRVPRFLLGQKPEVREVEKLVDRHPAPLARRQRLAHPAQHRSSPGPQKFPHPLLQLSS